MTMEEAIAFFKDMNECTYGNLEAVEMAIKALEQEQFINKPCISSEVCKHDKNKVLDKIRDEIKQLRLHKAQFLTNDNKVCIDSQEVLDIIDKYKAERED